jgi:hypothetical protein
MDDPEFLSECGITPDIEWLLEASSSTPEQQRFVLDMLRINMMLGGGMRVTLEAYRDFK